MVHTDGKKVVVVTGASRGLGKEIALAFGRRGHRVVVNCISRLQEAAAVVNAIAVAGGEAVAITADVRKAAEVDDMMNNAATKWGSVDIVVNNAGITKDGLTLRMTEEYWDDVIATNLTGVFYSLRAACKLMAAQRNGHIVNIASITGLQGREGQVNYAASKAGLIGFTKAAAKEFGPFNIKVNAVLPGYLLTEMGKGLQEPLHDRILAQNVLNRVSDPREVAEFIVHLSLMHNVSGQIFNLDSRVV